MRAPIDKTVQAVQSVASTSATVVRDAAKTGLETVGAPVPTALKSAGEAEGPSARAVPSRLSLRQ